MLEGCRMPSWEGKYSGKRQCSSRRYKRNDSSLSHRWSVISFLLDNFEKTKPYLELAWVDKVREPKQWEYLSRPGITGEEKLMLYFPFSSVLFCLTWQKSDNNPSKAKGMPYCQPLRSLLHCTHCLSSMSHLFRTLIMGKSVSVEWNLIF